MRRRRPGVVIPIEYARHSYQVEAGPKVLRTTHRQAFTQRLTGKLGSCQRIGAGVGDFRFPLIAIEKAEGGLEPLRCRLPPHSGYRYSVTSCLSDFDLSEIKHDIWRDVGAGIVNFVEQLLLHCPFGYHATGAWWFGDHQAAIPLDLDDGVAQPSHTGNILEARIGEVAAGDLSAAFDQVTRQRTRRQPVPIILGPAMVIAQRCQRQGGVGHASGNHHLGSLIQGLN